MQVFNKPHPVRTVTVRIEDILIEITTFDLIGGFTVTSEHAAKVIDESVANVHLFLSSEEVKKILDLDLGNDHMTLRTAAHFWSNCAYRGNQKAQLLMADGYSAEQLAELLHALGEAELRRPN